MAQLKYESVSKSFDAANVLKSVSLDVRDGELIALLGPSGCGKTTMLRLAAGFERPDDGRILKGGDVLSDQQTHVAPENRNMGIVFQSYALWPNMTVAENIAYPLKFRKLPSEAMDDILSDALEAVSLSDYAEASPNTLSGGQRQRVALARCLVMDPDAVLLDEPLANLDAHLREVMQATFLDFHDRSGATMIYVTHDQAEAMAMADRIAVMFEGRLAQVAKPQELYNCPIDENVASFIGQGSIVTGNLEGSRGGSSRDIVLGGQVFKVRQSDAVSQMDESQAVRICIRPEHVALHHEQGLAGRVSSSVYLGERYKIHLVTRDQTSIVAYSNQPVNVGESVRFSILDGWAFGEAL